MTIVDFYGKILYHYLCGNRTRLEMDIVLSDSMLKTSGVHAKERHEKKEMKEKNVNLTECTNYLAQLFYQTGKQYSCTRTKMGKLLSIAAFWYAKRGVKLFSEKVYKYDDCGAIVNGLTALLNFDIYSKNPEDKYQDSITVIAEEQIDSSMFVPSQYLCIDSLDEETRQLIMKVFLNFGAYSPLDLGKCINDILEKCTINENTFEIVLPSIEKIEISLFDESKIANNPLICFIFSDSDTCRQLTEGMRDINGVESNS